MVTTHNLGFPRIGAGRELKWALERYWRGESSPQQLLQQCRRLRQQHWRQQQQRGQDLVTVGDFSLYDHVLDTSVMFGVIPERYRCGNQADLDDYFRMARGRAPAGEDVTACEMTKWFDTNYHYIVPEFSPTQSFSLYAHRLIQEIEEAGALGYRVKPVVLGPLSYLWLGKCQARQFDKLALLPELTACYVELLQQMASSGVSWVQIDEPVLVLDLPAPWRRAFETCYRQLTVPGLNRLLASYFGALEDNLHLVLELPVEGLHIDAVSAPAQLQMAADQLPGYKVLSVGVIDGRNVWAADLHRVWQQLRPVYRQLGERLWIAPSCSLLHCPVDLEAEQRLDPEIKPWLSFALQKLDELQVLRSLLEDRDTAAVEAAYSTLRHNQRIVAARRGSDRTCDPAVRARMESLTAEMAQRRSPYTQRRKIQQQRLNLPVLPTTTIGSFPQTAEIRQARRRYRDGELEPAQYEKLIRQQIEQTVEKQLALGLDVLVHGEAERNDMVEYFGELLQGFAITDNGWVQSYGSRCVKPPIIYGDVARVEPMTVPWISYAQSLTDKPVKGMLTGPVTMLQWSFVRDDQPLETTCRQIALALRDEVNDLESAGIGIIQIDEAALREGLPLRRTQWDSYLRWAVESFRLCAGGVEDRTQIHTHMCYSEFNDIIDWIARLDADVITIETSRSQMELLEAFREYAYPNDIGPGTFDIHSPRIPTQQEIVGLLKAGARYIPVERLWVNPDCGLKTRTWPEAEAALRNMVDAARRLRAEMAAV